MEQMRIVKEMRERDRANGRTGWMVRPRYMVWENVPGAFSSGNPKGADFAAVIEEIIKVAEPGTSVSVCVPNGGWTKSGCYYAEDGSWSVAWRVHDAQFWGVPQRRKRISLVADFGGLSASEILFERKGLPGDIEPCGEAGQETAGAAGGGVEGASCYGLDHVMLSGGTTYQGRGYYDNVSGCLKTQPHGVCETISFQERGGKPGGGRGILIQHEHVGALSTLNNQSVLQTREPILLESNQNHATFQTNGISTALPASMGMGGGYVPMVTAYGISSYDSNAMKSSNPHSGIYEADTARTLDLNGGNPACNQGGIAVVNDTYQTVTGALTPGAHPGSYNGQDAYNDMLIASVYGVSSFGAYKEGTTSLRAQGGDNGGGSENIAVQNAIVRRLTPLECERLQGYPDGWTDIGEWVDSKGKKHGEADSPRYKALGNSIALPFWQWMFGRIVEQYPAEKRDKLTLGSLFDGIGGFPLTAQRNGIKPVWASEIEEFPIAVTKVRFPE